MAEERVKHFGHYDPMTSAQQEKDVETRFETATNLPTPLMHGTADLEEMGSRALQALELPLSEDALRAMQEGYRLGCHSCLHCAC